MIETILNGGNSHKYYILPDIRQLYLSTSLGLLMLSIGFILWLFTSLLFELLIGVIIGIIVILIGIRNEYIATPKIVILTQDGIINEYRIGGKKFIAWSSMINIWLFTGQKKWRGIKRKDSSLFVKDHTLPIFLSYEVGLAIIDFYYKRTGQLLPSTIMS